MPISFNEIPIALRMPGVYTEYDATRANTGPGIQPYKALMIGQKLASGTKNALEPIRITSAAQASNYFGAGSILHRQAVAWFANNTVTELVAVAFDDPAGSVAATGDIVFSGPATKAGTLSLYVGGQKIQVAVASGDVASAIATAVVTALTTKTNLPVTAAVDAGDNTKVVFTARNKGTLANGVDLRFNYFDSESFPEGVTAVVTALNGGTGVPDFSTLWPVLGDEHYNVWNLPYLDSASLAVVDNELQSRNGPLRQIDVIAFGAVDDTHASLGTYGSAQNSQFISVMPPAGKNSPTPAFEAGANYAGVSAYNLQIDPARPLQTLELSHVMAPKLADRFTIEENNQLLFDGISTSYVDAAGNVRIARAITFYQKNPLGADDIAYLDVNTLATLSYIRWSVRARLLLKYPRHKLADDGTKFGEGQAVATPKTVKSEIISIFSQWESVGLVEGATQFANELIVERNASDRSRLDVQMPPNLVNQLRVTALQIQFIV